MRLEDKLFLAGVTVVALLGYGLWFRTAVLDAPARAPAEAPANVEPAETTPSERPPRPAADEGGVDGEDLRRIRVLFRASF